MKSLFWKLGLFFLLLVFGVGQFGGCLSCIPELILPMSILIDDVHTNENDFDGYGINEFYGTLISTLQGMGYTVKLASSAGFSPSTSTYRTVILPAPFDAYTNSETQALVNFVKSGGKLIMLGEWSSYGNSAKTNLNALSNALGAGITFNMDTVYDNTNYYTYQYWPLVSNFVSHPTTSGVSTIALIASCSLSVQSPASAIAYASSSAYTSSSMLRGGNSIGAGIKSLEPSEKVGNIIVAAVAQIGSGKVVAIGEANIFGDDVYYGETNFIDLYSNMRFFKNIINW